MLRTEHRFELVIDLLPASTEEIANELSISQQTIRKYLRTLIKYGHVKKTTDIQDNRKTIYTRI